MLRSEFLSESVENRKQTTLLIKTSCKQFQLSQIYIYIYILSIRICWQQDLFCAGVAVVAVVVLGRTAECWYPASVLHTECSFSFGATTGYCELFSEFGCKIMTEIWFMKTSVVRECVIVLISKYICSLWTNFQGAGGMTYINGNMWPWTYFSKPKNHFNISWSL